jgi:hypothetical protein
MQSVDQGRPTGTHKHTHTHTHTHGHTHMHRHRHSHALTVGMTWQQMEWHWSGFTQMWGKSLPLRRRAREPYGMRGEERDEAESAEAAVTVCVPGMNQYTFPSARLVSFQRLSGGPGGGGALGGGSTTRLPPPIAIPPPPAPSIGIIGIMEPGGGSMPPRGGCPHADIRSSALLCARGSRALQLSTVGCEVEEPGPDS